MSAFISEDTSTSSMTSDTEKYYENFASEYFDATINADMTHLYSEFLALLPEKGKILDAGCGSGRDMLFFSKQGFNVSGLDSSAELARLAERYTGQPVTVGKIESMSVNNHYDGIWACASLLHIERSRLPIVIKSIKDALKTDGILFASIREGLGSRTGEDGRFYELYNENEFAETIQDSGLSIISVKKTEDVINREEYRCWINVLARKENIDTRT